MLRNATLLGHHPTKAVFAPLTSNLKGQKKSNFYLFMPFERNASRKKNDYQMEKQH
jgi:hypothetical protein